MKQLIQYSMLLLRIIRLSVVTLALIGDIGLKDFDDCFESLTSVFQLAEEVTFFKSSMLIIYGIYHFPDAWLITCSSFSLFFI